MSFNKEFQKLLKPNNIIIIIGAVVIGLAICHYTNQKNTSYQGFNTNQNNVQSSNNSVPKTPNNNISFNNLDNAIKQVQNVQSPHVGGSVPVGVPSISPDMSASVNAPSSAAAPMPPPNCTQQPTLTPSDLLPRNQGNNSWAANQVKSGGGNPMNFLDSGFLAGINTISGSLRNANLQLRSEPPAPTKLVSPWLNTTIEPDLMRAPFEIGCACPGSSGL